MAERSLLRAGCGILHVSWPTVIVNTIEFQALS